MDNQQLIPLAILGASRQKYTDTEKKRIVTVVPFVKTTPQWFAITLPRLFELYPTWHEDCRILAAQIMSDYPVHLFFDLDGKDPRCRGKEKVIVQQFRKMLVEVFSKEFGRHPDLSGEHWEIGSTPDKTSLHCHIISEAFVNGRHFCAFMKSSFRTAVEQRMNELTPLEKDDFLLCREITETCADAIQLAVRREHLVDESIYSNNAMLKLGGNRKPGKTVMQQFCMERESPMTELELLWRGLPNYALPTRTDYKQLTMSGASCTQQTSAHAVAQSHDSGFEKSLNAQDVDKLKLALGSTLRLGPTLQFDKVVQKISPHGVRQLQVECKTQTAQCVIKSCEGAPYYHRSNRTLVTLQSDRKNPAHTVARVICMHPECQQACQRIGWISVSQVLEKNAQAWMEEHDYLPFDHPLEEQFSIFRALGVQVWLASPNQMRLKRKAHPVCQRNEAGAGSGKANTSSKQAAKRQRLMHINDMAARQEVVSVCDDDQLQPIPGVNHMHVIDERYLYDSKSADRSAMYHVQPSRKQRQMDTFFNTHTHIAIRSTQGTGKSEAMLHQIKHMFSRNPDLRVLCVSTRRAYADDWCRRWNSFPQGQSLFYGATNWASMVNYMDVPKSTGASNGQTCEDEITTKQCVTVSLESLHRFLDHGTQTLKAWDLVILDEVQEIVHGLSSATVKHRTATSDLLLAFLQRAHNVWAADADLDIDADTKQNWFLNAYCQKPFSYLINQRRTLNREYNVHLDYIYWIKVLQEMLTHGKKICIVTNVKSQALQLKKLLETSEVNQLRPLKLLVVTGDSDDELKQSVLKKGSYTDCDVFIFTPFIGSGVNLDQPHFDMTFLYASSQSSTARQVFQQLNRVRHLKDNQVHVFIKANDVTSDSHSQRPQSLAETEARIKRNISLLMDSERLDVMFDPESLSYQMASSPYNVVYVRNDWECIESRLYFEKLLHNKMKQSGGKVTIIMAPQPTEEDVEQSKQLRRRVSREAWTQLAETADFESLSEKESVEHLVRSGKASEDNKLQMKRFELQELYAILPLQLQLQTRVDAAAAADPSESDSEWDRIEVNVHSETGDRPGLQSNSDGLMDCLTDETVAPAASSIPTDTLTPSSHTVQMDEEFLKTYGPVPTQQKFKNFKFATSARTVRLGGPAAAAQHEAMTRINSHEGERVEHTTGKFIIMKTLEQVLALLDLDKILTRSSHIVIRPDHLLSQLESDNAKKQLLHDCKDTLLTNVKPRESYSQSREWLNHIVKECRVYLQQNFGVTLKSHRQRQRNSDSNKGSSERMTTWTLDLAQWQPFLSLHTLPVQEPQS